jgi:SMC interacting uncharacterized protein involved in chromosome segregation
MDNETVEEIKRHFGIVAEGLDLHIQAVAEGQSGLQRQIEQFRRETNREFEETRALIRLSYVELERRMGSLESDVAELRSRMDRVEARVGR